MRFKRQIFNKRFLVMIFLFLLGTNVCIFSIGTIFREFYSKREDDMVDTKVNSGISASLPRCTETRYNFEGRRPVIKDLRGLNKSLNVLGGEWKPSDCVASQRVAIIIPYRNRKEHLQILMKQLHPKLQRQKLHYKVFVIEQPGTSLFNRAKLLNVGYVISSQTFKPDCLIFHDVDLVPEDDRNFYTCTDNPKHLSVAIDEHDYQLRYPELVGGVLAIKPKHFLRLNGYSNLYFGWGCEDDDFYWRTFHKNMAIERPTEDIATYSMLSHRKRENEEQYEKRKAHYHAQRDHDLSENDGLNTLSYQLLSRDIHNLYTMVSVDLGPSDDVHLKPGHLM